MTLHTVLSESSDEQFAVRRTESTLSYLHALSALDNAGLQASSPRQ